MQLDLSYNYIHLIIKKKKKNYIHPLKRKEHLYVPYSEHFNSLRWSGLVDQLLNIKFPSKGFELRTIYGHCQCYFLTDTCWVSILSRFFSQNWIFFFFFLIPKFLDSDKHRQMWWIRNVYFNYKSTQKKINKEIILYGIK